jgi:hypothetical protein
MIDSLVQRCNVVELLAPAADAGGRTSTNYASLKNAKKAWIIVHIKQGAANTILLSPLQATSVAGGGSTAGPTVPIWSNQAAGTADAYTKQTSAATFTTSAAQTNKIVVFELTPDQLDTVNGFDCIGISTGASNASNITSAIVLIESKFVQAYPPSALVD